MKYLIASLLIMSGCVPKPSNEMEQIAEDVLRKGQGIEIDVKPIPKPDAKH